jgi:flagellar motor protein MotB
MKAIGIISTAALSLLLGIAVPGHAQQEQHEQQQEQKDKPAQQQEKHAQQDKSNQHQEQHVQNGKSDQKEQHHEQQAQRAGGNGRGRIPEDHFRANFGREHVFVINRPVIVEGSPRFQYGGYWFGFAEPWPVGWYYTDNVYVDYVDGGYYLYNPVHPGIRIVVNVF